MPQAPKTGNAPLVFNTGTQGKTEPLLVGRVKLS